MAPATSIPSVAPTVQCHTYTDTDAYECGNIIADAAEAACGISHVATACAYTCCMFDPRGPTYLTVRATGANGEAQPTVYKGDFAHGVVNTVVYFYTDYAGLVDLIPVVAVPGVVNGRKTFRTANVTRLDASAGAAGIAVSVQLLSQATDGTYNLHFAVTPTGGGWARRFRFADADAMRIPFTLVNDYLHFTSPAVFTLSVTRSKQSIQAVFRYKSHLPVKVAASVFCDPAECGRENADIPRPVVLSNRNPRNLLDATGADDGLHIMTVRLGASIYDMPAWRSYRLQISMGTYGSDSTWIKTIGRTDRSSLLDVGHIIMPRHGASNGDVAAISAGSGVSPPPPSVDGSNSSASSATISTVVLGCLLALAVAAVAVARRRHSDTDSAMAIKIEPDHCTA